MKDAASRTKTERINDMLGEIKAHKNDDAMLRSIIAHHIGVLWQTIEVARTAVPVGSDPLCNCPARESCLELDWDGGCVLQPGE